MYDLSKSLVSVANPKILKRGYNVGLSAPSSYIENAHNELYAFYTGKCRFLEKKSEPIAGGGDRPHRPPPI